jgi:hypothetical protein
MSNFDFLEKFETGLFEKSIKAEKQYVDEQYEDTIHTLRKVMEGIVLYAAKREGFPSRKNFSARIRYMLQVDYINEDQFYKLNLLRDSGNDASHYNKVKFDRQDGLSRLQDSFDMLRWLYNRYSVKKIRDDFDLTKINKTAAQIQEAPFKEKPKSEGMVKFVKAFFKLTAVNGDSQEIVGNTGVLEIKVENRSIPYMALLRKYKDKISSALYPAIYVYKQFDVVFTVYGAGGQTQENWGNDIEKEKPLIQTYFENSGQLSDVLQKNPKYNYMNNRYEGVYKLSKLDEETYVLITKDFEQIQQYLSTLQGEK